MARLNGPKRAVGRVRDADRGLSTALGYALQFGIAALLISGLLIAVGGHVQDQRQRAVRTEFERVGGTLEAGLYSADRLARTTDRQAVVRIDLPDRVAGRPYRLSLEPDGAGAVDRIVLSTDDPAVSVAVAVRTETALEPTVVTGGPLRIAYDAADDHLEVTDRA